MRKIIPRLILAVLLLAMIFVASCSVQANQRTRMLEKIAVGDTSQSVIERLGRPSRIEPADQPYLVYASLPCTTPRSTRLWWEWPVSLGMEAWSVELDSNQEVLHTVHWVSP